MKKKIAIFALVIGALAGMGATYTYFIPNYGIVGAVGNGTTDDSAALVTAATAYSPIILPTGANFYVGTTSTLTSSVESFGGQITVGSGATLTINGPVKGPLRQIFIVNSGGHLVLKANALAPVEWFGAKGNSNATGSTGTDDTVAIQTCFNSLTAGEQCYLQARFYLTSATLTDSISGVGLKGVSYGAYSANTSNQVLGGQPLSAIVNNNNAVDIIDGWGASLSVPVSFQRFQDFTLLRTSAYTGAGLPAGLSIKFAGGFEINHVWSEDSVVNFMFSNAGAYGTGSVENSGSMWAANGFNPAVEIYGFYLDGTYSAESFRLRHSFSQTLYPGFSGVTSVGFFAKGAELNDLMLDQFETSFQTYGAYFQYTSGGNFVTGSDIHLDHCIMDTDFVAGAYFTGLTSALGGNVRVDGGWYSSLISGATGVDIESSDGITVTNLEINANGAGAVGIKAANAHRIVIANNNILSASSAGILLNTVANSTVIGNAISSISGEPTTTFISATGLTRSSLTGNALSGYGTTGINLDSTSLNNSVIGTNAIDPTHITTAITNTGGASNNVVN
jgi:hypothetical protein